MGEFLTADLIVEGVTALGSLGFFFLAYQALQILGLLKLFPQLCILCKVWKSKWAGDPAFMAEEPTLY